MEKNQVLIIIGIILGLIGMVFLVSVGTQSSEKLANNQIYYFYGNTCTHCKELDEYLEKANIEKKLKIKKLEVFSDYHNSQLMVQAAKLCELKNLETLGVPFVFYNNHCYVGVPQAKEFFQKEIRDKK